jgi:hypothetical protein
VCYSLIGKENDNARDNAMNDQQKWDMFDWLCHNRDARRSPRVWAEELGVKILDADGFEGVWLKSITLADFMERVQWATIQPSFFDKRG